VRARGLGSSERCRYAPRTDHLLKIHKLVGLQGGGGGGVGGQAISKMHVVCAVCSR
jgi:hypothetical protein